MKAFVGGREQAAGAGPLATVWSADPDAAFCAVAVDILGRGEPGACRRVLAEAWARCLADGGAPSGWPAQLAATLTARLAAPAPGEPPVLVFAAVAMVEDAVHVCTAGDFRVHLLRGAELLAVTGDHVLANEPAEWVRATYGDISIENHGRMLTRTLGACRLPPVAVTWAGAGPRSVLLCPAELHGHRDPGEYAGALSAALAGPSAVDIEGIALRFDR